MPTVATKCLSASVAEIQLLDTSATTKLTRKLLKVRTGCTTCNIRKVKCDEGKPACARCTNTGRICDGYAPFARQKRPLSASIGFASQQRQLLASSLVTHARLLSRLDPDEQWWIDSFNSKTGPALSGAFNERFWSHLLPQLSLREPAIRHAVLAISSSHAQFESETVRRQPSAGLDFSLRHYNYAIARLQQRIARELTVEIPLVCSLLFICLECLYGNQTLMLNHLSNSLTMLASLTSKTSPLALELQPIFRRLEAQSTLFGAPPSAKSKFGNSPMPSTCDAFTTYGDAKKSLDILIAASLSFVQASSDTNTSLNAAVAYERQARLQELFMNWEGALDVLVTLNPNDSREKMLRVQYIASFIFLSTCLESEEAVYDLHFDSFATLVGLARSILNASPSFELDQILPSFALDMSLIPSLYLTSIKCRHPVVRRQALALLESSHGREGLWDARIHSRVARRIIGIEEGLDFEVKNRTIICDPLVAMSTLDSETNNMQCSLSLSNERGRWVRDGSRVRNAAIGPADMQTHVVQVTYYTVPRDSSENRVSWSERVHF